MMTDITSHRGHHDLDDFLASGDGAARTRAFAKARRHSMHVRMLRVIFPILTVAVVGIYVFSILSTTNIGRNMAAIAIPKILPTDLAMKNPEYEGYAEDGSFYKVRAQSAKPNLKNPDIIRLEGITADLVDPQKKTTKLTATRGVFNNTTSTLVLRDGINITGADGLTAKLTNAIVLTKTKLITTARPVDLTFSAGSVNAKRMQFKQTEKHVTFSNGVKTILRPPPAKPATGEPQSNANENAKLFVGSDKPVVINSKTLDIFDIEKRAVFEGEVIAQQGDAVLRAPKLEASYDAASENKQSQQQSTGLLAGASGKLRRIVATGPVEMTQGPQDRVTSQNADFDALNETAVLTGDVVMTSGANRSATSDRVDLDQANERALLTGNVVVRQDKNILKGRRLEIDQKRGTTRLTSPAGIGAPVGQITARFVQANPATPAKPVQQKGAAGAFRVDPKEPLDIVARELTVQDKIKTATFRGGVRAKQGSFQIAAAELQALYQGNAALGNVTSRATPTAGSTPAAQTSLTNVKAKSNVVITGQDGQKVTGDWADFDVQAGKAIVGGEVEITQGSNVVQCSRLTIDTRTGRTIIDTAPKNTVSNPGGGGWVTTDGGQSGQSAARTGRGRPSAIFYFNDIEKSRNARRKPETSTGSAWEAQTAPR